MLKVLSKFTAKHTCFFARAIGVSPMRISHVVNGARPVTAELALLFGRALGQSPEYWLNLQTAYDLKLAEVALQDKLSAVAELGVAYAVDEEGEIGRLRD